MATLEERGLSSSLSKAKHDACADCALVKMAEHEQIYFFCF